MAQRFNPPPGWPPPPFEGWLPPDGWKPDPMWEAAPEDWQFVVDDTPSYGVMPPHIAASQSEDGTLSAHVRENIAGHKKTTTALCLVCGYNGLMGVTRTTKPWWARLPVLIIGAGLGFPVAAFLVGPVFAFILCGAWGLSAALAERQECLCPHCLSTIV